MSIPCEAGCGRRFVTVGAMNTHLTSSTKKCGGYLQGKLRDLGFGDRGLDTLEPTIQEESDEHWIDEEAEEVPYEPFFFQPLNSDSIYSSSRSEIRRCTARSANRSEDHQASTVDVSKMTT